MRMLKQIAPKFGRIWNGRQHSKSSSDFSKRSFMNVSIRKILLHIQQSFGETAWKAPIFSALLRPCGHVQ